MDEHERRRVVPTLEKKETHIDVDSQLQTWYMYVVDMKNKMIETTLDLFVIIKMMEIGSRRRPSSPFIGLSVFFLVLMVFHQTSYAKHNHDHHCPPSSCGNIPNISYPFRLRTDPQNCGDLRYVLSCENNNHSTVLYLYSGKYHVEAINYNNYTIRVVDFNIDKANCSSIPPYSLSFYNFSEGDPYYTWMSRKDPTSRYNKYVSEVITFLKCEIPMESPLYKPITPTCINSVSKKEYGYYVMLGRTDMAELKDSCRIEQMAMMTSSWQHGIWEYSTNISYIDIHNQLAFGFQLSWLPSFGERCYVDDSNNMVQCVVNRRTSISDIIALCVLWVLQWIFFWCVGRFVLGIPFVIAFLIYKWRRRHLSMYNIIEEFLQTNNNLVPIRYSYSDIRKMTKGLKDKLGEGGYGCVYKGKLRSGRLVAIKMLEKSKSNGQDFINEVSTIGRIHHVNVVQLVGFCVDGSNRALVYDFMPNGSLDKYIFSQQGISSLDCKTMCEIACGIACGIEYLHRGCNMQILHFDIKPHNILLDENFIPKVSDFGLARLSPLDNNIVSLTAARGTMGYIAPELFYKNIGRVSSKADVYSFGMLLMEMASRRKNLNGVAGHTSQTYFPSWVYDRFKEGNDLEIEKYETEDASKIRTEDDSKIRKKMIVVALWCIQMNPSDRPAMNRVKEMLEGEVESLQMPPKPFVWPQAEPVNDEGLKSTSECSAPASNDDSQEISKIIESC